METHFYTHTPRSGASWGGTHGGGGEEGGGGGQREAEEKVRAAKDEVQRHRNAAAAARRDAEVAVSFLAEAHTKHGRLEISIRDLKHEAHKQVGRCVYTQCLWVGRQAGRQARMCQLRSQ